MDYEQSAIQSDTQKATPPFSLGGFVPFYNAGLQYMDFYRVSLSFRILDRSFVDPGIYRYLAVCM
jgi:hypothetical protein